MGELFGVVCIIIMFTVGTVACVFLKVIFDFDYTVCVPRSPFPKVRECPQLFLRVFTLPPAMIVRPAAKLEEMPRFARDTPKVCTASNGEV